LKELEKSLHCRLQSLKIALAYNSSSLQATRKVVRVGLLALYQSSIVVYTSLCKTCCSFA